MSFVSIVDCSIEISQFIGKIKFSYDLAEDAKHFLLLLDKSLSEIDEMQKKFLSQKDGEIAALKSYISKKEEIIAENERRIADLESELEKSRELIAELGERLLDILRSNPDCRLRRSFEEVAYYLKNAREGRDKDGQLVLSSIDVNNLSMRADMAA